MEIISETARPTYNGQELLLLVKVSAVCIIIQGSLANKLITCELAGQGGKPLAVLQCCSVNWAQLKE